ncbi:hypothetical protein CB1_000314005 [Camelus ferus]|nr:hypothetical protein CB1_000314005 [Camelus ferus]
MLIYIRVGVKSGSQGLECDVMKDLIFGPLELGDWGTERPTRPSGPGPCANVPGVTTILLRAQVNTASPSPGESKDSSSVIISAIPSSNVIISAIPTERPIWRLYKCGSRLIALDG